jgi:hypothetical protein
MAKKAKATKRKPAAGADKGFIMVNVGRLPGEVKDIALNGGRTVEKAFEGADIAVSSEDEIRLNNEVVEFDAIADTAVKEGDIIFAVGDVNGGN